MTIKHGDIKAKGSLSKDRNFKGPGRYVILKYGLKIYKARIAITASRN